MELLAELLEKKKEKRERERKDFGHHYVLHLHLKGLNRRPSGGYARPQRLASPTYMHNFQGKCADLEVFFSTIRNPAYLEG